MDNIVSFNTTVECDTNHLLTISAVTNNDGTFHAWIVCCDGVTAEFPRCEITIRMMQDNASEEQKMYTITIPRSDYNPVDSGEMSYEDYENWKVAHGE